jgi:hypothetical protein
LGGGFRSIARIRIVLWQRKQGHSRRRQRKREDAEKEIWRFARCLVERPREAPKCLSAPRPPVLSVFFVIALTCLRCFVRLIRRRAHAGRLSEAMCQSFRRLVLIMLPVDITRHGSPGFASAFTACPRTGTVLSSFRPAPFPATCFIRPQPSSPVAWHSRTRKSSRTCKDLHRPTRRCCHRRGT